MIELRYADMPWGRELDEIVMAGDDGEVTLTMEDMGESVSVILYDGPRTVMLTAHVGRMPREMWTAELLDAWHERRLPCLWRTKLTLTDDYTP